MWGIPLTLAIGLGLAFAFIAALRRLRRPSADPSRGREVVKSGCAALVIASIASLPLIPVLALSSDTRSGRESLQVLTQFSLAGLPPALTISLTWFAVIFLLALLARWARVRRARSKGQG